MATEVDNVQNFFDKLEARKAILSTCTNLYNTLTSHFTSLEQSLNHKTQTIDTKIQTLELHSHKALESLQQRESSIPERRSSLSAEIESKKQAAVAEFDRRETEDAGSLNTLKSLCRKMDAEGLVKFMMKKRKESIVLASEMRDALFECVDPPMLVLDVVEWFLKHKAAAKAGIGSGGLADRRWACGIVVTALFPPDELKAGKKNVGPAFSGKVVDRAMKVLVDWKQSGDGLSGVGPSEALTFLQLVVGFGLMEKLDEVFLKKLVLEFASKRDIPKLAVPVFGEKLIDTISDLVKNSKEIEAVYLTAESGLTDKFKPSSLLNSFLSISKKSVGDIVQKGKNSAAAMDEAAFVESKHLKALIKCVEDNKLEAQFSLKDVKRRLSLLEKTNAEKKKKKKSSGPTAKPSIKRVHASGGAYSGGRPPLRPSKVAKVSNSFLTISQQNMAPIPPQSPVTRYSGAFNYPTQSSYEGAGASPYGPAYGAAYVSVSASAPMQHYSLSKDAGDAAETRLGSSIGGLQATYRDTINAAWTRLGSSDGGSQAAYGDTVYAAGTRMGSSIGGLHAAYGDTVDAAGTRLGSSVGGLQATYGDTIDATGTRLGNSIGGLQAAYGSYIYPAAAPSAYQPSSYAP